MNGRESVLGWVDRGVFFGEETPIAAFRLGIWFFRDIVLCLERRVLLDFCGCLGLSFSTASSVPELALVLLHSTALFEKFCTDYLTPWTLRNI